MPINGLCAPLVMTSRVGVPRSEVPQGTAASPAGVASAPWRGPAVSGPGVVSRVLEMGCHFGNGIDRLFNTEVDMAKAKKKAARKKAAAKKKKMVAKKAARRSSIARGKAAKKGPAEKPAKKKAAKKKPAVRKAAPKPAAQPAAEPVSPAPAPVAPRPAAIPGAWPFPMGSKP